MKQRIQIPVIAVLAVLLLFALSSAQEAARTGTLGIISMPMANVHDRPASRSVRETQVLMADVVRILEKQDYRLHIAIPSQGNREGWIQQEAVYVPKDQGRSYLSTDRPWVVISAPKTEALILDRTGDHKVPLYAGTSLPVIERKADSVKVQFPDRSVAIIDAADVIPLKPADPLTNTTTAEDIVRTARKFVGVQYLAGGLTAQGMDIRGLVYIVYRIHGFTDGTDHRALKARKDRIGRKDVQPGDILLFSGESEGLSLGGGRFLHAGKKGSIQPAGLLDRRYARAFQYGVRVIGADPVDNRVPSQMTADEIMLLQTRAGQLPLGKRIAFWAGRFIGTPYDPDPLGLYVRSNRIVADEKVDCMYHVFRSVELAESTTPAGAVDKALDLRFRTRGKLADGLVTNYNERFEYGEDMVFSGKWGRNITGDLGNTKRIAGSRGRDSVDILPKQVLAGSSLQKKLRDGDIVFWVKDPKKRASDEIVAHLSVIHVKSNRPYVIHAAGSKDREGAAGGGVVKELPFSEYVKNMHFIGAFITRFDQ